MQNKLARTVLNNTPEKTRNAVQIDYHWFAVKQQLQEELDQFQYYICKECSYENSELFLEMLNKIQKIKNELI